MSSAITLLHVFPTFNLGGSQVRTTDIVNHLGDGFRHLILAIDGQYGAMERIGPAAACAALDFRYDKTTTFRNALPLRRFMAASGADILVTYNWGSIDWGLANLIGRLPHVHIEDGFGPDEAGGLKPHRNLMRRMVFALGGTRVVLPSTVLCGIARRHWGVAERRLHYIANGIDCNRFAGAADAVLLAELGLAERRLVGTVAALRAEKNVGRLLAAFAQVTCDPPATLVIVGDGPELPTLQGRAAELGIAERVVFAGRLTSPERLLPAFDVFALSSDTEQMPYSILEAMAASVPVAGVDVGDVARMVSDVNRPFVTGRDEAALAGSLGHLLADPQEAIAVGAANRDHVRRTFDWQIMFESYRTLFRSCVGR